jgi:shikimate dehydrogenase
VAIACAAAGASRVAAADLLPERAAALAREIAALAPGAAAQAVGPDLPAWKAAAAEADLVVQATPVGMKLGDASPLPPDAFRKGQLAYDLVYMYPETPFMKAAAQGGARTANGLGMLLHQGAHALRIWTGVEPPVGVMRAALERAVYGGSR